jgi:hypothetical protein
MSPTRAPPLRRRPRSTRVRHLPMIMKTPLTQSSSSLVTEKITELRQPRRSQRRQEDAPRRSPGCPKYCNRCCQNCCQLQHYLQHYLQHSSIRVGSQSQEGAKGEVPALFASSPGAPDAIRGCRRGCRLRGRGGYCWVVSFPAPPSISSLPAPPWITSSPPPPRMVSRPSLP